ncbi:MAG: thioredoxin [Desulfobacterales bacterium]|nr:thioredoxin [Desulfobacterales bacterium]
MGDVLQEVSDQDFEKNVLQSDLPVLVDFWAPWCGPCKAIGPMIDNLANQYEGRIRFLKMNVDDNTATPASFGIKSVPTIMFFKDGNLFEQMTGMVTRPALETAVTKLLEGAAPASPFVVQ